MIHLFYTDRIGNLQLDFVLLISPAKMHKDENREQLEIIYPTQSSHYNFRELDKSDPSMCVLFPCSLKLMRKLIWLHMRLEDLICIQIQYNSKGFQPDWV